MKRGATPPSIEEWLRDLPEYSGQSGIGVYAGMVGSVGNPVFLIEEGVVHGLYTEGSSTNLWVVDIQEGLKTITTPLSSSAVAQGIVEGSGLTTITAGSGRTKEEVTREDVGFKIVPAG